MERACSEWADPGFFGMFPETYNKYLLFNPHVAKHIVLTFIVVESIINYSTDLLDLVPSILY